MESDQKNKNGVFMKKLNKIFFEENAQAGAVFRLMIDAIIGLVILGTILSTLTYFDQQQMNNSVKEFQSFLYTAVSTPNGKIIDSGNLTFNKDTGFTTIDFELITTHKSECFLITGAIGAADIKPNAIKFLQKSQIRVFAKCEPVNDPNCNFFCTISFGKKIEQI